MLRYLLNIPPSIHLILLISIPILRLPTFLGDFYLEEESLLMLLGHRIADGNALYAEAWYAGPPLMPWLYAAFAKVFGSSALTAIRVTTCGYVYLSAVYFNGILAQHKLFRKDLGLTSLLYVLLVSTPWHAQQMSASLFVLLPMTVAFNQLMELGDKRSSNLQQMYRAGVWMMVCILASYKAVFILVGLLIGYFLIRSPQLNELLALIGGLVVVLGSVLAWMFFQGTLAAFWDIGVLYYWDRINLGTHEWYQFDVWQTLQAWLLGWGSVLLFAIIGFLHFRVRFFSYVVKIRSAEMIMATWLTGVSLMLLFKYSRLELSDFVLLVPPIVFYAKKLLDFRWFRRLRWFVLIAVIAIPVSMYLSFGGIYFPNLLSPLRPAKELQWLHGNQWPLAASEQQALQNIQQQYGDAPIWIMDHRPDLYLRLGADCANRYTDFRIAVLKFGVFTPESHLNLRSHKESDRKIYQAFRDNLPALILDSDQLFPELQAHFPNLLQDYQPITFGPYRGFSRSGPPTLSHVR